MVTISGKDAETLAAAYEPAWKNRLRRNLAHARFPETAPLLDRYVDPAYFGLVVNYLAGPQSRLIVQEGHFGGIDQLAQDVVRAALVPRPVVEPQSTIAMYTLACLVQLNETADKGRYDYNPTLAYAFMRHTARNRKLLPEVQDQAATYLTRYSRTTQVDLQCVLDLAVQQDDARAYTSEALVEELFAEVHVVRHLTWKADRLLDATENPTQATRSPQITIVPDQVRSDLKAAMNRGIAYLCEAAKAPKLEDEEMNTTFLNLQHYICAVHQSRHLTAGVRKQIQALAEEITLFPATWR